MEIRNRISTNTNHGIENIYKTLVEESPMPVALYLGREMRVSHVNAALLKVWGKDEHVVGKTFREALPELDGQPYYAILDDVYTSGIPYQATEDRVELFVDGKMQTFYFNFTYKPLKDDKGEIWGILNTATDVTELVLTKKRLEEAEENTRFALRSADLGTWTIDPHSKNVVLDKRSKELFSYWRTTEPTLATLLEYVHYNDQERVKRAFEEALWQRSSNSCDIKFRTVSSQNKVQYVRCTGKIYHDKDNSRHFRFSGILEDITKDALAQKDLLKFRQLIENSEDLIGLTDTAGNIIYLNKAGQQMIGAESLADYYQVPSSALLDEDQLISMRSEIASNMTSGGTFSGEINYKHLKTGETIPCFINAFTITDPETGEPLGMASVTRDLRPEKNRQREQQKLLTLVENSKDLMSILETDGFNSYLNRAGKELLGFDSDEQVRSTPISNLHHPNDIEFVKKVILKSIEQHGSWTGVMKVRHLKTGEVFPVFNSTIRIEDPDRGSYCIGAIMRDLRPELAAKQALAEREKLFRDITTAAPAALWMTDANKHLTYINQIWIDWTGAPFADQLGFGWTDFIATEDRERVINEFAHDFELRRPHECQFRLRNNQGKERWVICSGNPHYKNDGSFNGYIGTSVDITELKQLQRQKDEFLGIASHELKTPVTSIKAYAQVLESMFRDSGDDRKADMVKKMDAQVNRLTNLIADLLDVTKIQTGRLLLNESEFDFNSLVKELTEDLQRTTKKHQILLDLQETGSVLADKERIGQVLTNLITNAIKYSPNADKIMVFTRREEDTIRLSVQDFGIGIPNDKKDKVFEQFYRVSGSKQHTFPGLGLGLYISAEIIKRAGGKIWVNTEEGKGSTFCFSLPILK